MKKTIKFLVYIYHLISGSSVASCRFTPTCSQYLLDSIEKYGTFKGLLKTTRRVFSCHPLSRKPIYDPV